MVDYETIEQMINTEFNKIKSSILSGSPVLYCAPVATDQVVKDTKRKTNKRASKIVDIGREQVLNNLKKQLQ